MTGHIWTEGKEGHQMDVEPDGVRGWREAWNVGRVIKGGGLVV